MDNFNYVKFLLDYDVMISLYRRTIKYEIPKYDSLDLFKIKGSPSRKIFSIVRGADFKEIIFNTKQSLYSRIIVLI